MKLQLPLKKGERPLFKALQIVENIYRDYQRNGNAYETTKDELVVKWVAELYVLADILRVREFKGMRNNSYDLFNMLKELPLFFKVEQVKSWEVEKKWNTTEFVPYKSILLEYEISFDTLTPSSLYQANDKTSEHIWQHWLIKTPIKEVVDTLEYSAQSLLEWNNLRSEKSHLEINLKNLSKYVGVTKQLSKHWYYLQILGKEKNNLWTLFLRENNNSHHVEELLSVWEKSLQLPTTALNSLLYEDSILVELGFYNAVNNHSNSWEEYWQKIEQFNIPNINKVLLNQNNILHLFLRSFKSKENIPIEMFSYIKGLQEHIHLISQLKKGKVLIYGKHLSGKKSLINTILNQINYKGFVVNHKEHRENEVKNKKHELKLADNLLSKFSRSALVIENAEENYELKSSKDLKLNLNNSLQFYTISNINEVNKNFLKTFDIVIEMESPPLKQRIELAKIFFEDESVAIRVSQTLKEPFEIIRIGKLCELAKDFSWSHISLLIASFNNLESLSNKINLNKLDNDEEIIPLVGYPDLQELLNKLIHFYKNPNDYMNIGAKADKGVLLVGPPGTGKTHFARNLSKMVNIPIFAPDTSVLASNLELVQYMFNELKKHSPCILFLDEIDTLIANPKTLFSVDLEKQKIVNTFLSNIDGIESNDGILIIGTTHRKDNFDPAAIRSGRLSKVINLNLPNEKAREEIWAVHLKNKKYDSLINMNELAQLSVGFSCADIMEASNKAAIFAVESGSDQIDINHLKVACDETFWGYTDNNILVSEKQKLLTAYHEAGHALLAWKHGYNVQRITIRPRQNALGATHFVGEEGVFNMSLEVIKNKIQVMLGGICAEKVIFGYYENGGIGDLSQANKLVYHALAEAGLGKEGPFGLGDPTKWSNERKLIIEAEEKEIMLTQFQLTEDFILLNKELLTELATHLLQSKEISGEVMIYFKNKLFSQQNLLKNIKVEIKNEHLLHNKNE